MNCEKKQNPTQKTSFVAKCTNCNEVVPIYSWQMFGKSATAGADEPYEDETELLRKSASVNIDRSKNLVINPDTFILGEASFCQNVFLKFYLHLSNNFL